MPASEKNMYLCGVFLCLGAPCGIRLVLHDTKGFTALSFLSRDAPPLCSLVPKFPQSFTTTSLTHKGFFCGRGRQHGRPCYPIRGRKRWDCGNLIRKYAEECKASVARCSLPLSVGKLRCSFMETH